MRINTRATQFNMTRWAWEKKGLSGGSIWNVAIRIIKPMMALLWAWTSVLASLFVKWLLVGMSFRESQTK
jgi:hypothetical protein